MDFFDILTAVTVPGADNGAEFTDRTRLDAVLRCLDGTVYHPLRAEGVAYLMVHGEYNQRRGAVLVSCHLDHCYNQHFWTTNDDGTLRGTFDNTITLAVLLEAMREGRLHPQTLVAFTGDEEEDSHGAEEAIEFLQDRQIHPELFVVLDVTEEGYGAVDLTLENILPSDEPPPGARLRFKDVEEYRQFLLRMVDETAFTVVEAEPDEAWTYDEYDVNCLTLCLPSRCPDGMHADSGIFIRQSSIVPYGRALERLTGEVCRSINE